MEVVGLIAGRGEIGRGCVKRRRLDDTDQRPFGYIRGSHIIPGFAAILRNMHQAIIRACPEKSALQRRFAEGKDCAIVLCADIILGDWAAGGSHLALVVACEVGTDHLPTAPFIGGTEDVVASRIQHIWIVRREQDRERPLEAIFRVAGGRPKNDSGQTVMSRK